MEIISKTEKVTTTLTCNILDKVVTISYEQILPETPTSVNVSCKLDIDPSIGVPVLMPQNNLNMTIAGTQKILNIQGTKYSVSDLTDLITNIDAEVALLMTPVV